MSFHKISAIVGAIAMASHVAAHGTVTGIVADGVYYQGYHANFQYMQTQPVVVGWSIPEDLSNGFIAPAAYTNPDIICHLNATNAQASATVKAGGTVELQWTAWPSSHHGPVIDYLASCDGDCKTVDKNKLEFFKIDGVGLIGDATVPGTWASDQLIANNNSWVVTIPLDIAPGNYVLRHEIIALHSAEQVNGAQNYPQCVNLEVTGSGTATPSGVLGTALYSETDPGIEINIYTSLSTYIVPGPALYSDAISVSQTAVVTSSRAAAVATVSSAPSQIPFAPVATITTSSSGGIFLQTSGAPYFNSTSNSIKSACKAKSSAISGAAVTTPKAVAAATTSSEATLSIRTPTVVETIATVSVPAVTFSSLIPTSTTSSKAVSEPAGTTLSDLLSWISSFYNKFKGTSYDGNTVARRHARDVARAEIEKFDGASFAAGATQPGCPHPTGYHHHSHATGYPLGTKCTKPTGAVTSSFTEPTTGGHVAATELHPCGG